MMTHKKIVEVIDRYEEMARKEPVNATVPEKILAMIPKLRKHLADGKREKVMRWIGFMQGALWARQYYTLEELKSHNRADPDEDDDTCPECNGTGEIVECESPYETGDCPACKGTGEKGYDGP